MVDSGKSLLAVVEEDAVLPGMLLYDNMASPARRIKAYQAGVDDYLEAMTAKEEIIARIERTFRRVRRFKGIKEVRDLAMAAAIHDSLTGLYNHGYFHKALQDEIERAKRYQYPLSLIMIDLDHFKRVNESHGHPLGDLVLRDVALRMKKLIRATDIMARFGGEEFCILLPHTAIDKGKQIAERIHQAVRGHQLQYPSGLKISLTVSMGLVAFPLSGENANQLLLRVSDALYRAKRGGRDRINSCLPDLLHLKGQEKAVSACKAEGEAELSATLSWLLSDGIETPLTTIYEVGRLLLNNISQESPSYALVRELHSSSNNLIQVLRDLLAGIESPPRDGSPK
jgi:diguanylate cyclase (GGDEF)-like protein